MMVEQTSPFALNGSMSIVIANSTIEACRPSQQSDLGKIITLVTPVAFGIIFLLGLIGNTMVLMAIACTVQLRVNSSYLLIGALSLADLLFVCMCLPSIAITNLSTNWAFGDILCRVSSYTVWVCAYLRSYTIVLMASDRYLATVHPITSTSMRSWRKFSIVFFSVWFLIFGANSMSLFQQGEYSYEFCGKELTGCKIEIFSARDRHMTSSLFPLFQYLVPCLIIGCLYFNILRSLRNATSSASMKRRKKNRRHKVTLLVSMVFLAFAACWLPTQMYFLVQLLIPKSPNSLLVFACNSLAYTNSCLNLIICGFCSENFRQFYLHPGCSSTSTGGQELTRGAPSTTSVQARAEIRNTKPRSRGSQGPVAAPSGSRNLLQLSSLPSDFSMYRPSVVEAPFLLTDRE